uniref:Uncharacterized protein n=1 Tax=Cacopsylla melanoneura TaxID=428564 RepID=A0A8D8QD92_9HEMI
MEKPLRYLRRLSGIKLPQQDSGGDGGESGGNESDVEAQRSGSSRGPNNCSLPLLQVWPSQDSPSNKTEREVQSFLFEEDASSNSHTQHDSGIESVQVSPCPGPLQSVQLGERRCSTSHSPKERRASSSFLHPDHARFLRLQKCVSTEFNSMDDETQVGGGLNNNGSMNSSSASSMASIAQRHTEAWERRRSSVMTARYSLLDALDLEYALIRAAARGSVGPYSLTDSLHKLTFTQSLAFPALARGLAHKRRRSSQVERSSRPLDANDTGLNTFAKVITALVLMLVSVLVFFVVYKFVKT